jgi:hypothetical protein
MRENALSQVNVFSSNLSHSQCLHPKETAMLNHRKKKKTMQDHIPKIMRSGLSLSTSFFFYLFFCCLNGAGWFCNRIP